MSLFSPDFIIVCRKIGQTYLCRKLVKSVPILSRFPLDLSKGPAAGEALCETGSPMSGLDQKYCRLCCSLSLTQSA